jgi:hypothetical protein
LIVLVLPNWVIVPGGALIFAWLPLPGCPKIFENPGKFAIEGSHPWKKFPKDDSPLMALNLKRRNSLNLWDFSGVLASPEIGTDAAQIAP